MVVVFSLLLRAILRKEALSCSQSCSVVLGADSQQVRYLRSGISAWLYLLGYGGRIDSLSFEFNPISVFYFSPRVSVLALMFPEEEYLSTYVPF